MIHLRTFFIGLVIGISNVIPGISGGTIAVTFNIYERLLGVIRLDVRKIIKELPFLLALGSGMAVGIVVFARLLSWLFEAWPVPVYLFFTGVIVGSVPIIWRRVGRALFSPAPMALSILGAAVMVWISFVKWGAGTDQVVTVLSLPVFGWLLALGAIAACTMIIPGISGSLVLLALGGYQTLIRAAGDLNLPLLLPAGIGVAIGLLLGAWLLRAVLARFPVHAYSLILGLVAASVLPLFPGLPEGVSEWAISVTAFTAGVGLTWWFSRAQGQETAS
ncbi:MAG TPA: DUF368 domain-containing protein [Magnetospirillaceae bacterium]|nr:DUF368 domain-containing protein [Magnetospirillaceae bacterium]